MAELYLSPGSRPLRSLSFSAGSCHVIRAVTFRQQILRLDGVGVWRVAEEAIFCSWLLGLGSYVAWIRKLIQAWSTCQSSSSWWFPPMLSSTLLTSSTTPAVNLLALIYLFQTFRNVMKHCGWHMLVWGSAVLYTAMPWFRTCTNNGILPLHTLIVRPSLFKMSSGSISRNDPGPARSFFQFS